MSINCITVGVIPFELSPDDKFRVDFDISAWLDTVTIASVTWTAIDEFGTDATATVLTALSCTFTDTVLKPSILGGVSNRSYTVKMKMTASDASIKNFYIKWSCREVAS